MTDLAPSKQNEAERETRSFNNRVLLIVILAFAILLVVIGRLVYVQIHNHEAYQTQSQQNRIQIQSITPPRGLIFDSYGELLADNRQILSLALIPERVDDLESLFSKLQQLVPLSDVDLELFRERISVQSKHDPIVLKRDLTDIEQARLALHRHDLDGVVVTYETIRHYLYGEKFVHALGTVRRITKEDLPGIDKVNYRGTQFIGGTGIERFYERSLHGTVGSRSVEVDASGRPTREQPESLTLPVAGATLNLYIEANVQLAADRALGDRRGAVVAIDPKTGGILAMVSKPAYDPNRLLTGLDEREIQDIYDHRDKPLFNRAVQGVYEPGSTFKPVVALLALKNQLVDWDEELIDTGVFRLPNSRQVYRSWNRTATNPGGHGKVDLFRAIYRSANVYFYRLGSMLDVNELESFASTRFGLGKVNVFDIQEARTGLLPSREWKQATYNDRWYQGDSVILGIGQGYISVTPLQLATIATVLANRGGWVQPRLLKRANKHLLEVVDEPQPLVYPPESPSMRSNWERIANAMSAVVHRGDHGYDQNGTAWAYIGLDIPYTMAGKSGTAQVIASARDQPELPQEDLDEYQRNHALFIAFAPLAEPKIAVAVIVENGGGGSRFAAPVARAVIDAKLGFKSTVASRG